MTRRVSDVGWCDGVRGRGGEGCGWWGVTLTGGRYDAVNGKRRHGQDTGRQPWQADRQWWDARRQAGSRILSSHLIAPITRPLSLHPPAVSGVTIYFSDFKRNIVDKLQKDFFAEPSREWLVC